MARKAMILKQQADAKFSTRKYNRCKINQRSHDYLHVAISTVLQSEKVQKDGSAAMPQRPCTHLHSPGGRTAADLSWRNTLCPSRDMRGGGLSSAWSLP